MDTAEEVRRHLHSLHEAVWELAAVVLGLREATSTEPEQRHAAEQVLAEAGVVVASPYGVVPAAGLAPATGGDNSRLAAQASTALLQAAAVVSGAGAWAGQDDDAIVAQGRASAQAAPMFKTLLLPRLAGLEELLTGPSPAMLDVGVGVAAMAVAFCAEFPRLQVVGLDLFDRALELARRTIEGAGVGDRIELRHQDVASLQDRDVFSLAWLPAPFIPRAAIDAAMPRLVSALVPGGWLLVGHGRFDGDSRAAAITRFQTAVFGGTALDRQEARRLLEGAGSSR